MKKKVIAVVVGTAVALPGLVNAAQVAGEALEIYGKVHVSIDSVSAKDAGGADVNNISISGNSSRLGFKGKSAIGSMTGFYKYEASIKTDESGGNIDHRGAYVGLKGGMGSVLVGYRDTPFKDIRGKFDVFGDTVGDARNIMGSVDGTDTFNVRAKNVLMYTTPQSGGVEANIMYSTSYNGTDTQGQDNNDTSLTSLNVIYKADHLVLAAGYEEHKLTAPTNKEKGARIAGAYDMGSIRVGLMYEKLDNDNDATARHSSYGINAVFKTGDKGKVKLQYVKAGDNDVTSDTGANNIAVGYDYKLDKQSATYIMYSKVSNDANASYGIGGGHDSDKYTVGAPGQDVSAISIGYIYKF
jgi:predicted porin